MRHDLLLHLHLVPCRNIPHVAVQLALCKLSCVSAEPQQSWSREGTKGLKGGRLWVAGVIFEIEMQQRVSGSHRPYECHCLRALVLWRPCYDGGKEMHVKE
jgi:hypothetical protein